MLGTAGAPSTTAVSTASSTTTVSLGGKKKKLSLVNSLCTVFCDFAKDKQSSAVQYCRYLYRLHIIKVIYSNHFVIRFCIMQYYEELTLAS